MQIAYVTNRILCYCFSQDDIEILIDGYAWRIFSVHWHWRNVMENSGLNPWDIDIFKSKLDTREVIK